VLPVFFSVAQQPKSGLGRRLVEVSRSHSIRVDSMSVGQLEVSYVNKYGGGVNDLSPPHL
jgi:hypothetical protein